MKIVYRLIGTKELKKVYVRLYHNKLNLPVSTNLISRTEDWDSNLELFKKNKEANKKLIDLKINIENAFNSDFSSGVIMDKAWLKNIVTKTFLRPNKEEKLLNHSYTIFLDDFGIHWLENDAKEWKNSRSKLLTNKAKSQKLKALEQFKEFQSQKDKKIRLIDFTTQEIKGFYDFLIAKKYSVSTAKKTLSEIKFLCKRALELKFNVCLDFEQPILFKDDSVKVDDIYLNESEINTIFNYDFSDNETMDIIRDNFILSLWTGKRISDLMNLNSENLMNGIIESIDIKTNAFVKVPLHPQVKAVIKKYFGCLPPKVNKDEYNLQIKEICRLCKIDAMTYGKVFNPKTERKVTAYYEKHKLVTSHTARRSFATNLSRFLPLKHVAKILGWSDEKMVNHYNKTTEAEAWEKFDNHFN
jgi:integrase